ncbi:MAG TPA: hypothetical protein VG604_01135 [Candidatus Saccharimonadales bacterium]|nr:hypothetical protein [Candidatus Saccharimonadales bacterium]
MSVSSHEQRLEIQPGQILKFAYLSGLVEFEDQLAGLVSPGHNADEWDCRTGLDRVVRPDKTNGSLTDIMIVAFQDPRARLADAVAAHEAGEKRFRGQDIKVANTALSGVEADEKILGFWFRAVAMTGKKTKGPVSADLWYVPRTAEWYIDGQAETVSTVRRIPSVLRYDRPGFEKLDQSAIARGNAAMRNGGMTAARPSVRSGVLYEGRTNM